MCCPIYTAVTCPLLGLDLQWSGWSASSYSRHQDSLQYKYILKNVMMPTVRLPYTNRVIQSQFDHSLIHDSYIIQDQLCCRLVSDSLTGHCEHLTWTPSRICGWRWIKLCRTSGPSCQLQTVMLCGPMCQMPGMKLLHLSVMFDLCLSCLSAVAFKGDPFNLLKPSGKFAYHQVVFTLHLRVSYGSQNKQD